MRRVVVTVVGSRRRVNLAIPAESPVRELVGALAERCGEEGAEGSRGGGRGEGWMLTTSDSRELPSEGSLRDAGLADGAVVYLKRASEGVARSDGAARPPQPRASTIPKRLSPASRLLRAASALFRPGPPRSRVAPGTMGGRTSSGVGDLAAARRTSPLRRVRRSWASSDYVTRLEEAVSAPRLRRCVTVAVMSPKGGVGKTTMAALVGTLLATLRNDRVVAVDSNPDHGSLGRSLTPEHTSYVDDLLYLMDSPSLTATALDAAMGRGPDGLMILPAPTDPARMARLDEEAYTRVIRRLQQRVGVLVLDCGTGLQDPAALAALKCTDEVILVTDAEPATASLVVDASRLLSHATRPLALVVNKMPRRGSRLNLEVLVDSVSEARGVVLVPDEPVAASRLAAGEFTWSGAPRGWQIAVRELTAVLFDDWRWLGLTS